MIKRLAIFGTESTGKTTLAKALADHFGEPWAPEYVREFWDRQGGVITSEDLTAIARGQIANEATAVLAARGFVICDTDLLMNVRWADDLFPGQCADWVRAAADERARRYALYLYCEPDLGWTPDPQRSFADAAAWQASAARCRAMLEERKLPVVSISGQGAERVRRAIKAIESCRALQD